MSEAAYTNWLQLDRDLDHLGKTVTREQVAQRIRGSALFRSGTVLASDAVVKVLACDDEMLADAAFDAGADVNMNRNGLLIDTLVRGGHPDSLRVLLRRGANLYPERDEASPLSRAYLLSQHPHVNANYERCLDELVQAGAIEARKSKFEFTELMKSVLLPKPDYALFLLRNGADMHAVSFPEVTIKNMWMTDPDEVSNKRKNLAALEKEIKHSRREVVGWQNDAKLHLPELAQRYLSDTKVTQTLHTLLGAGEMHDLISARKWARRHGVQAGLEFMLHFRESLPKHLTQLRERIDVSGLQRQAELPREWSVTAGYVRGAAVKGRDAG